MIDIEKLVAGLELDALVGEKVMGWTDIDLEWRGEDFHSGVPLIGKGTSPNGGICGIPHFSNDIAAAWEVIEKLKDGPFRQANLHVENGFGHYGIQLWDEREQRLMPGTYADTMPLAICRAALRAVGVDK